MPNTVTINLERSDYTHGYPNYGNQEEFGNDSYFAYAEITFDMCGPEYNYATINISYTGDIDYGSVIFSDPNHGIISIGESINGIFTASKIPDFVPEFIFLNENFDLTIPSGVTYYIILNSDVIKSNYLYICVSLGKKNQPPLNSSVTITCDCGFPLYGYTVGLHAYSPYDSVINNGAKLTTNLYSFDPIDTWHKLVNYVDLTDPDNPVYYFEIGTILYSSKNFTTPALPWWYGIGDKVYKVGGKYDRAYGTKEYITVQRYADETPAWWTYIPPIIIAQPFINNTVEIIEYKIGPMDWTQYILDDYGNLVKIISPTCIERSNIPYVGMITEIYDVVHLLKPDLYRYYMGFSSDTQLHPSELYFTLYSYARKVYDPITGSRHAIIKSVTGIIGGWGITLELTTKNFEYKKFNNRILEWIKENWWWMVILFAAAVALSTVKVHVGTEVVVLGKFLWDYFIGPLLPELWEVSETIPILADLAGIPFWPFLLALAIIIYFLLLFFNFKEYTYYEECRDFLHVFTNTPYIEVGSDLRITPDMTTGYTWEGYYSDGIYFYDNIGTYIVNDNRYSMKQHQLWVNRGYEPPNWGIDTSITPDVPTLVTDFIKLLVLPYMSGKPISDNFVDCEVYVGNDYLSREIVLDCEDCAMVICESPYLVYVVENTYSGCTKTEANTKAKIELDGLIYEVQTSTTIGRTKISDEDHGVILMSYFTHELKIEEIPTMTSLFYDKRTSPDPIGPIIGTTLYYDYDGCTRVLDGYYGITGETYYRTFYYTISGDIDKIYYMLNSGDTETIDHFPINKETYIDYQSNWYIYATSTNSLEYYINNFIKREFKTTDIYNPIIPSRKGFSTDRTESPVSSFETYPVFTEPDHVEADTGLYQPLIPWIFYNPFYYHHNLNQTIEIEEDCDFIANPNAIRGIWVFCKDESGNEMPMFNSLLLHIYFTCSGETPYTYTGYYYTSTVKSRTFIPYSEDFLKYCEGEVQAGILDILSENPINKVTYGIGDVSMCDLTYGSGILFCVKDVLLEHSVYLYNPLISADAEPLTIENDVFWSTYSLDIAHTENKLWLYKKNVGNIIDLYEWNITLEPWYASINVTREITLPYTSYIISNGLTAINDTTLIGGIHWDISTSDDLIIEIDLVNSIYTEKFYVTGRITGDLLLTTTNKLIVTHHTSGQYRISQYDYITGYHDLEIMLTGITNVDGLYTYNNEIYLVQNNVFTTSDIYHIDKTYPYAITNIVEDIKVKDYGYSLLIYGASNLLNESTAEFEIHEYSVGELAFGGIVAYILQPDDPGYDPDHQHGLIIQSDYTTNVWGCTGNLMGNTLPDIGTGNANTTYIINGCIDSTFAAKDCSESNYGGYGDWFLPSKDELVAISSNYELLSSYGFPTDKNYWSSTEYNNYLAIHVNILTSAWDIAGGKNSLLYVKPIRQF